MLPSLYIKGPNVLFLFTTALALKKEKWDMKYGIEGRDNDEIIIMMTTVTIMITMVYICRIKWICIMFNVEARAHLSL